MSSKKDEFDCLLKKLTSSVIDLCVCISAQLHLPLGRCVVRSLLFLRVVLAERCWGRGPVNLSHKPHPLQILYFRPKIV